MLRILYGFLYNFRFLAYRRSRLGGTDGGASKLDLLGVGRLRNGGVDSRTDVRVVVVRR